MVRDVVKVIVELGSSVSLKKSAWTSNQYAVPGEITFPGGGGTLPWKDSLDLLGTLFTPDEVCAWEVQSRISKMWNRYFQLKPLLAPRSSSLEARMNLFMMTIRRTAVWGAGSWRLRVPEARALNFAEMDIVRRIIGVPKRADDDWLSYFQRSLRLARSVILRFCNGQLSDLCWTMHWRWGGDIWPGTPMLVRPSPPPDYLIIKRSSG